MNETARKPVTAEGVLDVAVQVFAENGYAGTTLDKVAGLLGLTRQGILHYFPTKQDLFTAVLQRDLEWARRRATRIQERDEATPLRGLRSFVGGTEEARAHIRLFHVLHGEAVAGNKVALYFVTERATAIQDQVSRRVLASEATVGLRGSWTVGTATSAVTALIHGLQAAALLDPNFPVENTFDAFIANLEKDS